MSKLRASSADNPISQEEALAFLMSSPDKIFEVQKIEIPIELTKEDDERDVRTVVLARDGDKIAETTNVTQQGFGVDTRVCLDGSLDQYAKKPNKVIGRYTIDDGRSFEELKGGETVEAMTVRESAPRKAFVAEEDMYLATTWGKVQFVARGGLVTFLGEEAIGNNNPCDMVIHTALGNGQAILTRSAEDIRADLEAQGLEISSGVAHFLTIAREEDAKNPYIGAWKSVVSGMKMSVRVLQRQFSIFAGKAVTGAEATRREVRTTKRKNVTSKKERG